MLKNQPPTKGRPEYIRENFACNHGTQGTATKGATDTASDFGGNSGAPISDPAHFCWNLNTRRAGGRSSLSYAPASRRSGGSVRPGER